MRTKTYTLTGQSAAAANIVALAAPAAGVAMTIAAQPAQATELTLTSAADASAVIFDITGTNRFGGVQTESINGPNANTVRTIQTFATVTSIIPRTSSANTVSVGVPQRVTTPWILNDITRGGDNSPVAGVLAVAALATPVVQVEYRMQGPSVGEIGLDIITGATLTNGTLALTAEGYAMFRLVNTAVAGNNARVHINRPGF